LFKSRSVFPLDSMRSRTFRASNRVGIRFILFFYNYRYSRG
jgi:hypothetical protein